MQKLKVIPAHSLRADDNLVCDKVTKGGRLGCGDDVLPVSVLQPKPLPLLDRLPLGQEPRAHSGVEVTVSKRRQHVHPIDPEAQGLDRDLDLLLGGLNEEESCAKLPMGQELIEQLLCSSDVPEGGPNMAVVDCLVLVCVCAPGVG